MKKARHTPGPWRVEPGVSPNDWPGIDAGGESIVIYGDGHAIDDAGVRGRTREQAFANARLIAAAPDMLGLLGAAASQFRFYEQQHLAKGTPEADAKAKVNRDMAESIEALLARVEKDE